jgi:hypothetical protein
MTEFENTGLSEQLLDAQEDHRSIRDVVADIASFPDFGWRQTRLARYGATALAVIAGSGLYSSPASGDQTPVTAGIGPEVACAAPTPDALKATTALFNGKPYRLTHAPAAYDHSKVIVNPSDNFLSLPDSTVATHYGLSLPTYTNQLFQNYETSQNPSYANVKFKTILEEIRETETYLSKFGVQVEIGTTPGELDGFTAPTQAEINKEEAVALEQIAWDISDSPTAYIHLSGLRKIVLSGYTGNGEGFEWTDPHTVVWNVTQLPHDGEMSQAVYEGIDAAECGFGNTSDPNYTSLNERNIYGPLKVHKGLLSEDHLIFQQPTAEENKLANAINAAYNDVEIDSRGLLVTTPDGNVIYKDPTRVCRLLEDYDIGVISRIAVMHHADFSSAEQDKFDLGAQFDWASNGYNEFLDPAAPILRRKALFLLARLYELDPSIVEYFAGFSGRPGTLGGVVDCTKYGFPQPKGDVNIF